MVMVPATKRAIQSKSRPSAAKIVDPETAKRMARVASGPSLALFLTILAVTAIMVAILAVATNLKAWLLLVGLSGLLVAFYFLFALKIADQWEKAVVLRFGRFVGLRDPGRSWIVPIMDMIPRWVDHRVMVTPFDAEKTLTKDTEPVDVDAVLFWLVWDPEKAALEVEDCRVAIAWAAQTALREIIGQMDLADILVGRAKMDVDLRKIIDERTTP